MYIFCEIVHFLRLCEIRYSRCIDGELMKLSGSMMGTAAANVLQICGKQSSKGRLMRCIIYSPLCLRAVLPFVGREGELYSYTGVGLSGISSDTAHTLTALQST